jgi:predicted AAA+ superfamily ATPase
MFDTMDELDILDVARTWSFWDTSVPASVPRDVDLPDALADSHCLVIQGVRRCGKSTLLQQLVDRYGLDPALCALLNLEDPRLSLSQTYGTLERLVELFRTRYPDAQKLYFFLDEIQGAEGWQRWLRAQLDRPRGNIFVITGSNATLLSGELSSALSGRHLTVELFPFHLDELRRSNPDATLDDYLFGGGFPEPSTMTMSDGDRLRRQYFHDIVERDIRERVRARSSLPIRQVVQMAYESAGSELSLRRVAATTGIAVDTAGSYLEACEAAYLLFSCPFFAFSARKRASRNRKYYPVDTGLRRVIVTRAGADRGKALECATYLALRRLYGDLSYWRGRGEVDFVVRQRGRIVPVQVCWDEPLERHHRALEDFYEAYPQSEEAVFVTAARFEEALSAIGDRLSG